MIGKSKMVTNIDYLSSRLREARNKTGSYVALVASGVAPEPVREAAFKRGKEALAEEHLLEKTLFNTPLNKLFSEARD